jgi:hypothetical protein
MRDQCSFMVGMTLMFTIFVGCTHNNSKASQNSNSSIGQGKTETSQQEESPSMRKIVRERGWEIPGLAESDISVPRKAFRAGDDLFITDLDISLLLINTSQTKSERLFILHPT